MVIGQYQVKISSKGRTALPKRFREFLGDNLVVTVGYEKSLMLVSSRDWQSLIEGTKDKPFILNSARDTNRFLLGEASEIDLDDQGRFVIPAYLRDYAKIGEELVFLGLNKYVEVWAKESWQEYQKYLHENIGKIAERLGDAGAGRE